MKPRVPASSMGLEMPHEKGEEKSVAVAVHHFE
jgi:hypothetical protein